MKKISLITTLLSAILLLQNCKKDTVSASTTSTQPMIAVINDTTWNTDTVKAVITYYSATKTKVLSCIGTGSNKMINLFTTQHNATSTAGYALSTYSVNVTTDNEISFFLNQKNAAGSYVFTQQGVVAPGSGSVVVTSIDSVKKTITGTYSFSTLQNNYDANGNITSVIVNNISAGGFNGVPYTFVSQ